jgi:hypothetical protein
MRRGLLVHVHGECDSPNDAERQAEGMPPSKRDPDVKRGCTAKVSPAEDPK